jgi:hypothetical protein
MYIFSKSSKSFAAKIDLYILFTFSILTEDDLFINDITLDIIFVLTSGELITIFLYSYIPYINIRLTVIGAILEFNLVFIKLFNVSKEFISNICKYSFIENEKVIILFS